MGGTETRPLNRWRIVHCTSAPDARIVAAFTRIEANPALPEYIEIYVRDILGITFTQRDAR